MAAALSMMSPRNNRLVQENLALPLTSPSFPLFQSAEGHSSQSSAVSLKSHGVQLVQSDADSDVFLLEKSYKTQLQTGHELT